MHTRSGVALVGDELTLSQALELSENSIGDMGASALAGSLSALSALQSLVLAENSVRSHSPAIMFGSIVPNLTCPH
jgi:hypothetical protein